MSTWICLIYWYYQWWWYYFQTWKRLDYYDILILSVMIIFSDSEHSVVLKEISVPLWEHGRWAAHIIFIILETLSRCHGSPWSWFCGFSPSQVLFKCCLPGAAGLWGLSLVQDTGSSAYTMCDSCINPPKYIRVTKVGPNASNFSVIAKFTVYQTRRFVRGPRVETPAMWVLSLFILQLIYTYFGTL